MYCQQPLFYGYILLGSTGAGRYFLDYWLTRRPSWVVAPLQSVPAAVGAVLKM
ncbi:hypothetical protein [Hymenobacter sublimis]|uniref:Uncharacterized protein n=1 Tax=Hymenobacter sublimis TaxID=2933777 RepID=A0ABY4JCA5_9BACT|nr:hypothetical protein [Hymenobacter sublimis]UPL50435.1 hypothetical protein MWH26_05880 [Hymenobacter sublimis]